MNRKEVITGSVVAVLAAVGIGQLCLDKGTPNDPSPAKQIAAAAPKPEPQPITADEVVSGFMTSLEQGSEDQKLVALTGLLDELAGPTYAKAALSQETAEPLAKAAIEAVSVSTQAETPEIAALRVRAAGFIAARTRGPVSREFVLKMLEEGTPEIRAEIARNVGRPHGVRGKAVFAKIQELGEKGQIPIEVLVGALQRLGGKKAVEPILALLKNADHWKPIGGCVTALEEYQDPALLAASLERLAQTGLSDTNEKMPWISPKLFGLAMGQAEGAALRNGLRAARTRPSLVKVSLEAVKRGLDSAEPETRRLAAEAVRKAAIAKVIDAGESESLLTGRLGHETEPVLKAELTGGLEQIRGLLPKPPQGQQ